jgi:uncharacterized protein YndB with AHSA1/START domain
MQTLHFTTTINASREKVWNTMLGLATYRIWTAPFNPPGAASSFKGDWSKGSKIFFVGIDDKTGKDDSGMYGEIVENKPHEFISVKQLGELKDGVESPWPNPEQAGFENYTLVEKDGGTEVLVEIVNLPDEWAEMMNEAWPKALAKLKEITEGAF